MTFHKTTVSAKSRWRRRVRLLEAKAGDLALRLRIQRNLPPTDKGRRSVASDALVLSSRFKAAGERGEEIFRDAVSVGMVYSTLQDIRDHLWICHTNTLVLRKECIALYGGLTPPHWPTYTPDPTLEDQDRVAEAVRDMEKGRQT